MLGFVGSLKPWHGVDLLAETFRRLATNDPRLHLLVVGEGPGARHVEALAAELPGRVTRVGPVPQSQVASYLRAMDIAVAPYPRLDRFYYSPLKVLEYMATGRAVVASEIGQVSKLIRHQETGVLVPAGAPAELADAIAGLAADGPLRRRLGAAAAAEVKRQHLWTHRVDRILALRSAAA
ncbi:MAG: glycosyltransferase [Gammaproteobacteria bacterium]|nr:glycosyltransferase [Gammaproteobacteria bacterium]